MWRRGGWLKFTDMSEEHTASMLRVEAQATLLLACST
jgi:hypothetical protein